MSDKSFTFNWHEQDRDSFLSFCWIVLISEGRKDDMFDEVMAATDGGREIEMTITANGVEMDAGQMFQRLEDNWDHHIANRVKEMVSENSQLEEIQKSIRAAELAIKETLTEKFKAIGIEWNTEDEY